MGDVPDNDTIRKRIGERIAEAREGAATSRRQLANALDVSVQALSKWETGEALPTPDKQSALARALGVPWSELFNPDDEAA